MNKTSADILIKKREDLIKQFLNGNEPEFPEKHASLIDEYFFTMFEKSSAARDMTIKGSPFAVIALGGYGRKEQCIHSDIDLLILFKNSVPPEVETFIQELLYPLWDALFEV